MKQDSKPSRRQKSGKTSNSARSSGDKIHSKSNKYAFFASCAKGMEGLLEQELLDMGIEQASQTVAGVYFGDPKAADHEEGYKACLWSRLANRILLPLARLDAYSADTMFEDALNIPWEDYVDPQGTLIVDFVGTDDVINNSQFGALRIKDAVVDRLRAITGERPSVDKQNPDLRINARLSHGSVALSLDMAGESLHRRGYRTQQGLAPLKENLAAAVLMRSGWPELVSTAREAGQLGDLGIVDPMCGSGTLLIEAQMMAADIAPGLMRQSFGFETWRNFESSAWDRIREDAHSRKSAGLASPLPKAVGYDSDSRVLQAANSNIQRAKLQNHIVVSTAEVKDLAAMPENITSGLVVTNPPYGERLGELDELSSLYRQLGDSVKANFQGWRCGVFTGAPQLGKSMGIRAKKRYKLFNGPIASELLLILVEPDQFVHAAPMAVVAAVESKEIQEGLFIKELREADLSDGAVMVLNRIRKNLKPLRKWAKGESIDCFRVYDADIPEYSAAIDVYGDNWHVQEYRAPKTVDEEKAKQRMQEIVDALVAGFNLDEYRLFVKQRRRQSGSSQYQKQEQFDETRANIVVNEGPAKYSVNLWSYLDSGVFLDHRPVRKLVADLSRGKRLLNLFCYTGTATVQSAVTGTRSSVSVDMSRNYIKWAQDNFELNNISEKRHELVTKDCFEYLKECRESFDVIMLDPPSFSNSKKTVNVLDIQKDHAAMIKRCMDLLAPGGTLVFSNNLRSFKLDQDALERYNVKNISAETIDRDYKRNAKIHQCWLIQA